MSKSSSAKATRGALSLKEKYEIVQMQERGLKAASIARTVGYPAQTIYAVLKQKDAIKRAYLGGERSSSAQRVRQSRWPELDAALRDWLARARAANLDVTDDILTTEAEKLARQLGISSEDFSASHGFISRFKARHQVSLRTKTGEGREAAADHNIDQWLHDVLPTLMGMNPRIFSMRTKRHCFTGSFLITLLHSAERSARAGRKRRRG